MNRSFAFLAMLAAMYLVPGSISVADSGAAMPELPKATMGQTCVEPVEYMRREHMNLLFHQRDRTVHDGERETRYSLTGCLDCHTQKDDQGAYIPINDPGQFCEACHSFSSVKMDCFQCHATRPAAMQQALTGQ